MIFTNYFDSLPTGVRTAALIVAILFGLWLTVKIFMIVMVSSMIKKLENDEPIPISGLTMPFGPNTRYIAACRWAAKNNFRLLGCLRNVTNIETVCWSSPERSSALCYIQMPTNEGNVRQLTFETLFDNETGLITGTNKESVALPFPPKIYTQVFTDADYYPDEFDAESEAFAADPTARTGDDSTDFAQVELGGLWRKHQEGVHFLLDHGVTFSPNATWDLELGWDPNWGSNPREMILEAKRTWDTPRLLIWGARAVHVMNGRMIDHLRSHIFWRFRILGWLKRYSKNRINKTVEQLCREGVFSLPNEKK